VTVSAPTAVRCKCGLLMETREVGEVTVALCRECDHRRCYGCHQYVQDLTATACPRGHVL
jgi:hypothetical protein